MAETEIIVIPILVSITINSPFNGNDQIKFLGFNLHDNHQLY